MNPLISIIIPCYNHGKYLRETVESVKTQTLQNWEIIIVNDGSTDNTEDIAKELEASDSRVQYCYQDNSGPSAARNRGVYLSKGKYILLLDGDDKIGSEYIQSGVNYMEEHKSCTVFYCKANYFGVRNESWNIRYVDYKTLLAGNSIFCSAIIRREDYDRIGGFDEKMRTGFEDWEFFIRLLQSGGSVFQDSRTMFFYRQIEGKTVNSQALEKYLQTNHRYIYEKHKQSYAEHFGCILDVLRENQQIAYKLRCYEMSTLTTKTFSYVYRSQLFKLLIQLNIKLIEFLDLLFFYKKR